MATTKVTYTLDEETVTRIADAAKRLSQPKSQVVRDAVASYHSRLGEMTEVERARMLEAFDRLLPTIPTRPVEEVEAEIEEIRRSRRAAGRRRGATAR